MNEPSRFRRPLGDYPEMARWSGHTYPWGPEGAARSWFGGQVVDGLLELMDDHLAEKRSRRGELRAAAIGCVPWLTSKPLVDRLAALSACCVVLDKREHDLASQLQRDGQPLPNTALSALEMTFAHADDADVIGPYSQIPQHDVGPVRELGYSPSRKQDKPLLHAKVLVLGDIGWRTYDTDVGEHEEYRFVPRSVWMGSANWTTGSASHIEQAIWTSDPQLVSNSSQFISSLIRMSEPFGTTYPDPMPTLVDAEYDDEAMAEAAYDQYLGSFADGDPEEP